MLTWGEAELRDLPWRRTRDPWIVLVSEVMLQQTQVRRVIDALPRFLGWFPDAGRCAAAPVGDVVKAWVGLGYNRRAVMLHRAAVAIVDRHGGEVPSDLADLLALAGIGPYTGRAVRAFAFEEPAAVVDTNIGRLYSRLAGRTLTGREVQALADRMAENQPPWMWNQSLMEIGALRCTARSPRCDICPLASRCAWRGTGHDPSAGSAGVSGGQPRFEGSDRQLRGRLVDAVRVAPVTEQRLGAVIGDVDPDRADRIVAGLIRDGLITEAGGVFDLP